MSVKRKLKRDETSSESDNDDDFDPVEFAALTNYDDDKLQGLRQLNETKGTINNESALMMKYDEIALPRDWPWVETLTVFSPNPIQVEDLQDDLKREAAFYASAFAAVKTAIVQLEHSDVPYKRPTDFYAESVKPDSHMAKIKQVLLNDQKRLHHKEQLKKQREQKKYAKQVHSQRVQEKHKQRKDAQQKIDQWKKRQTSNNK